MMKIRKAIVEDATGIGTVHVDSWRTTYKDIIPDEFLEKIILYTTNTFMGTSSRRSY
ncbi:hypothetical protein OL548_21075 [Lysinibacillus sp. MHQ-1]|nr:hypothetical protein OL548_21075 [Lysinibacillus sp. MHQ-1]